MWHKCLRQRLGAVELLDGDEEAAAADEREHAGGALLVGALALVLVLLVLDHARDLLLELLPLRGRDVQVA